MNAIEKITHYISQLENKDALQTIGRAVTNRLEELTRPKGQLNIELINGVWFAIPPGQTTGKELGKQLTMTEVLKQLREKQPTPTDFELTANQAATLRAKEPERVGWWHDSTNGQYLTHYYDIPPFQDAIARWKQNQALAHDPLTTTFRMSLETVRQLRELEESGYDLVYPG